MWFLKWLASLLTGPLLQAGVDAYKMKLEAGNNSERIAADLAGRELEVQRREAELQSEYKRYLLGRWYEPTNLFGYTMVFYFGKVVLWDKVLAPVLLGLPGHTDPIAGDAAVWAGLIMMFFVGKRGLENLALILKK